MNDNINIIGSSTAQGVITEFSSLPAYHFDECCQRFKAIFGFKDFSFIEDKNGNTCIAKVKHLREPENLGSWQFRVGLIHVISHIVIKDFYEHAEKIMKIDL